MSSLIYVIVACRVVIAILINRSLALTPLTLILPSEVVVPALHFLCIDLTSSFRHFFLRRIVLENLLWLLFRPDHRLDFYDNFLTDVSHRPSFLNAHSSSSLLVTIRLHWDVGPSSLI